MRAADVTKNVDTGRAGHCVLKWILLGHFEGSIMQQQWYMDYVRHGEIQGRYLVFFKAHGPVFYHV